MISRCSGISAPKLILLLLIVSGFPPPWEARGDTSETLRHLHGRLLLEGDLGIGGAKVEIEELNRSTVTDADGRWVLGRVPAGSYTLSVRLGSRSASVPVTIASDVEAKEVDIVVDWPLSFADTVTVEAASLRVERAVEAPAAVTVYSQEEIARQAGHDQLPRLLAFAPGMEPAQSGLYDVNLNARGFNSNANRRILVLIDGRDPSVPTFTGSQEWAAVSFPTTDLSAAELVRGPGAALYGAGAFNGVLNLTTRDPRSRLGGVLRVAGGELDSLRMNVIYSSEIGGGWFGKVLGSYSESDDFTRSRVGTVEYEPGRLPAELIAPPLDRVRIATGAGRLDRDFGKGRLLTLEAGTADIEGMTIVTGGGRFQRNDLQRPWARARLSSATWSLQSSFTGRDSGNELSYTSGLGFYDDSSRLHVEIQHDRSFARGKGKLVLGLSHSELRSDSADPSGLQTLIDDAQKSNHEALFAQADYELTGRLKGVVSLRLDESNLHDLQLSPRVALVYRASDRHTLRWSFNEGFQSPTLVELSLALPLAAPLDLSRIEEELEDELGGIALGFESIPVLAVGNPDLEVEKISNVEVGYHGVFGSRWLLSANFYRSELTNFATPLLPFVGTSLGRLSGAFPRYAPPDELSADVAAQVLAALRAALPSSQFDGLSSRADGSPFVALISLSNFGEVRAAGVEIGLNRFLKRWRFELSYTQHDFDIREALVEIPLVPNAPDIQVSGSVSYVGDGFDATLKYRWADGFDWLSGIFSGPVPAYDLADLVLNYEIDDRWRIGLDVANLFDHRHYEFFGGDILSRRALLHVSFSW